MHSSQESRERGLRTHSCMTLTTLITAHPAEDSLNSSLAQAWRRGAERSGATVRHFDVNTLRFDPVLRNAYRKKMADEPDLAELRASIEASSHVTWVFPTWWVGMPAMMKGLVRPAVPPRLGFQVRGQGAADGADGGEVDALRDHDGQPQPLVPARSSRRARGQLRSRHVELLWFCSGAAHAGVQREGSRRGEAGEVVGAARVGRRARCGPKECRPDSRRSVVLNALARGVGCSAVDRRAADERGARGLHGDPVARRDDRRCRRVRP